MSKSLRSDDLSELDLDDMETDWPTIDDKYLSKVDRLVAEVRRWREVACWSCEHAYAAWIPPMDVTGGGSRETDEN